MPQMHSPHLLSVSHGLLPSPLPSLTPGAQPEIGDCGRDFIQEVVQEGEGREGCCRTGRQHSRAMVGTWGCIPLGTLRAMPLGPVPKGGGGLGMGVFISHPVPGKLSAVPGVLKGGDSRGLPCTR